MIAWVYRLGWLALMAGLLPVAATAEPLLHDPFARPFQIGSTPSTGANTPRNPKLIAVIVDGEKSLVNLNGTIIGIGEEKDGYRLIKVWDRKAIFKKRNKWVELEMSSLKPGNERGSQ
jgi:hypothetical protein